MGQLQDRSGSTAAALYYPAPGQDNTPFIRWDSDATGGRVTPTTISACTYSTRDPNAGWEQMFWNNVADGSKGKTIHLAR